MTLKKVKKQKTDNYSRFFLPFILIITAIVFANMLGNDFIDNWDDQVYVLNNEIIKQLNWKNLKVIFSSFYIGNYHPLTMLSYAIEYKLFGLNPFPFHLTNYILHLLNVILVYLFFKRFIGKSYVAAITSLFFALHPMHVESVAWISERKDLLFTFFFLLSLNSYSKYLLIEKKISYLIWSFLWFFLSLLSKPAAVCLPLVLALMDFYHHKKVSWKTFISKIPFFALSFFFGILTVFAQRKTFYDPAFFFSFFDRVFLVSYSIGYYLFKVFVPFNLCALHYYPVKSGGLLPTEYYFALPVLLLLIWGVFKSGRFKHELIFGLLLYFITIALELQIIPVGQAIVSERYSYIPYIGIFFIFGQFFSYVKDNEFSFSRKIRSIVSFVLVIFIVLYSFLTHERNKIWKNGEVLFTDVIEKYPEQGYGWLARGLSKSSKGDFEGAIADYTITLQLKPTYNHLKAFCNRGISFMNLNRMDESFSDFNKAIKLDPKCAETYFNRGSAYYKTGNYENAVSDFTKGLKIKLDPMAYYCRGFSKFSLNDKNGACSDWLLAQQYGNLQAAGMLEMYCK